MVLGSVGCPGPKPTLLEKQVHLFVIDIAAEGDRQQRREQLTVVGRDRIRGPRPAQRRHNLVGQRRRRRRIGAPRALGRVGDVVDGGTVAVDDRGVTGHLRQNGDQDTGVGAQQVVA